METVVSIPGSVLVQFQHLKKADLLPSVVGHSCHSFTWTLLLAHQASGSVFQHNNLHFGYENTSGGFGPGLVRAAASRTHEMTLVRPEPFSRVSHNYCPDQLVLLWKAQIIPWEDTVLHHLYVCWPGSQGCPKFSCAEQSRYVQRVSGHFSETIFYPPKAQSFADKCDHPSLLQLPTSLRFPVTWLLHSWIYDFFLGKQNHSSHGLVLVHWQYIKANGEMATSWNTAKFPSCVWTDALSVHKTAKITSWNVSDGGCTSGTGDQLGDRGLMKKGGVERDLPQLATGASAVILISCVYIYTYIIHTVPLYQQDGFTKYMSTEITLERASALGFPPASLQQLPRFCKTHQMKGTVELQHDTIITSNRWAIRSELTGDWASEARGESFGETVTVKVIQFSICTSDSEIQQQSS